TILIVQGGGIFEERHRNAIRSNDLRLFPGDRTLVSGSRLHGELVRWYYFPINADREWQFAGLPAAHRDVGTWRHAEYASKRGIRCDDRALRIVRDGKANRCHLKYGLQLVHTSLQVPVQPDNLFLGTSAPHFSPVDRDGIP